MITRVELEDREAVYLAPYAILSRKSRGRIYPESESAMRTAFQKDRDRVLHTTAFRRLEAKTQVFLNIQGDHYRTRLTHTLEVQQVARSVALNLGLNETLAETIALAHDLGHPPFGHAGETVLNNLVDEYGGFDHNQQSERIVTLLEDRASGVLGLNLTRDTLDGLNKHHRQDLGQPSLEAQVVDAADALAYTAHDLDDGLRSGLLSPAQLSELPLWAALLERTETDARLMESTERRTIHRELLGWLITDLTQNSEQNIVTSQIKTPEEVWSKSEKLVTYSPKMKEYLSETAAFLHDHLYRHWKVEMQVEQATRVLTTLYQAFVKHPTMLPPRPLARLERDGLPRTVCDHIAGMTDRYALHMYANITPVSGFSEI